MTAGPSIGERGRCFTLEVPLESPDGFGGAVRSWQPGPLLWGSIEFISARENAEEGRIEDAATHRVTLPYRDGVGSRHRLVLGSRRFRIRHAGDPDGRRRSLVCLVEELPS